LYIYFKDEIIFYLIFSFLFVTAISAYINYIAFFHLSFVSLVFYSSVCVLRLYISGDFICDH